MAVTRCGHIRISLTQILSITQSRWAYTSYFPPFALCLLFAPVHPARHIYTNQIPFNIALCPERLITSSFPELRKTYLGELLKMQMPGLGIEARSQHLISSPGRWFLEGPNKRQPSKYGLTP